MEGIAAQWRETSSIVGEFMLRLRSANETPFNCSASCNNHYIKYAPFGRRMPAAQAPLIKGRYMLNARVSPGIS